MEIIIDDREQNNKIVKELSELKIFCDIKRLKIGDYSYKNILIEMKSVDDFALSIIDGRLKRQVENMENSGNISFLMVYGKILDRKVDISENCIIGKIVSLSINHKIKIIWVDNERQIAYAMKRIFERFDIIEKVEEIK